MTMLAPMAEAGDLLASLRRLDALLDSLVRDAQASGGVAAAALRGMFVSAEEAASLLVRPPAAPAPDATAFASFAEPFGAAGRLHRLAQAYGLTPFELDLMVIALAPELDLRYERIYGFLQDDTTRRRATVDLALSLRCASASDKIAHLAVLLGDCTPLRHGLLHLVADPAHAHPPLLAHAMVVDPQIAGWLVGGTQPDPRLAPFCRLEQPRLGLDSLAGLNEAMRAALRGLVENAQATTSHLVLHLHGPPGVGRRAIAAALAVECGLGLLSTTAPAETTGPLPIRLLVREAWLRDAVLYLDASPSPADLPDLPDLAPPVIVLAGRRPWRRGADCSAEVIDIPLTLPAPSARRALWADATAARALSPDPAVLNDIAGRFRLGAGQIGRAAADAVARGRLRGADWPPAAADVRADLFAGARAQSGGGLAALAPKVDLRGGWDSLVLPAETGAHLREFCEQARQRHHVLDTWGFARSPTGARGLNGLFAGPPGTGKTMAAGVIAGDLGLDLYCIDLAQVVSKYIGETQKNLDQIFRAAEDANAVLLFDEADALFGNRSEARDAHDRYANIEVAYLLQKMESHDGIAILATNLRQNLDPAFMRRLHAVVEFPFPDEAQRRGIWQATFPHQAPLHPDLDLDLLAREVKLAGGNIRNIALAAAARAAGEGGAISMRHLLAGAAREYQKLGRAWTGPAP